MDPPAEVMMRAPNLCAVKIEGAQVVLTSNDYTAYIPCGLHALILVQCDLKVRSRTTRRSLSMLAQARGRADAAVCVLRMGERSNASSRSCAGARGR